MASIALAVLGAAPTIIQGISSLVHGIENIFGHGNGKAKKQAVVNAFQGAATAYNAGVAAVEGVDPKVTLPSIDATSIEALGNLVDAIVAFYNATGIFSHSTGTAPAK